MNADKVEAQSRAGDDDDEGKLIGPLPKDTWLQNYTVRVTEKRKTTSYSLSVYFLGKAKLLNTKKAGDIIAQPMEMLGYGTVMVTVRQGSELTTFCQLTIGW